MNILNSLEELISEQILKIYPDLKDADFSVNMELSPETEEGDLGFGCFSFAKVLKMNPKEIAENISGNIVLPAYIEKTIIKGPYLNFVLNREYLFRESVSEIIEKDMDYGSSDWGKERNTRNGNQPPCALTCTCQKSRLTLNAVTHVANALKFVPKRFS